MFFETIIERLRNEEANARKNGVDVFKCLDCVNYNNKADMKEYGYRNTCKIHGYTPYFKDGCKDFKNICI